MLTENVTQANEHTPSPLARTKDLVVNELPDEVLVYDLSRHKAHCLNQTAAQIWHLCNGQRTPSEIARLLAQELDKPVDEEVVWLAMKQLDKVGLFQERLAMPETSISFSRRAAMRRLGLAAAIALPLVTSIIAPMAVEAATGVCSPNAPSCKPTNPGGPGACTSSSECCSCCCSSTTLHCVASAPTCTAAGTIHPGRG